MREQIRGAMNKYGLEAIFGTGVLGIALASVLAAMSPQNTTPEMQADALQAGVSAEVDATLGGGGGHGDPYPICPIN